MAENRYIPDMVSPPGETLLETLDALRLSRADLAKRIGQTEKMVDELIEGETVLTPAVALQLEHVLEVPASFWNSRERHYREALTRQAETRDSKKNRYGTSLRTGQLDSGARAASGR